MYVPIEAFWKLSRERQTKDILKAASLWIFFRLSPWGPDYKRAWELQCSLQRDGRAEITGFDDHITQIIVDRQTIREALHTTGISLSQGNLTPGEKGIVTAHRIDLHLPT